VITRISLQVNLATCNVPLFLLSISRVDVIPYADEVEYPAIAYEEGMKYVLLPGRYITRSSIQRDGDRVLFVRPDVASLFRVLNDEVVEGSSVLWILGSPGVGKSLATFVFTCTLLDPLHVITWVFLRRQAQPLYVRFADGKRRSGNIVNDDWFEKFLRSSECENRIHLLALDGYTDDDQSHSSFPTACHEWVLEDMEHRRHISVISMSPCKPLHPSLIAELKLRQEHVGSWTQGEYREALHNRTFFNQVKINLDAHVEVPGSIVDYQHMMESKFYFGGGSCRYMFDYSTKAVIEDISVHLSRCGDLFPYLSGTIGPCSNGAVNHLLCSSKENPSFYPVSDYAATVMSKMLGPMISNLRSVLQKQMNPSMDRHLFEMWFFEKVEHGNLNFLWRWVQRKFWWLNKFKHGVWRRSVSTTFDPEGSLPPICTLQDSWLKPLKWNQGGYDAVFLQPTSKSVTFVQLARSHTHSFKPKYFRKLLDNMKNNWCLNLEFLDICFVVPSSCVNSFYLQGPEPEDFGLFEQYTVGSDRNRKWQKHEELTCTRICSLRED
jgi:hypothetical protein